MTKKDLISNLLDAVGIAGNERTAQRKELAKLTVTDLEGMLKTAKQQKPRQQARPQPQKKKAQQARPAQQKKAKATPKARSKTSVAKALRARSARIAGAIKAGRIAVKQGVHSVSEAKGENPRQRNQNFVRLYKGKRVKGVKAPKLKMTQAYTQISGTKYPYYVSSGYRLPARVVGGGKKGPGIIRVIKGKKAKPFRLLDGTAQARVVSFLNSAKGLILRSKGAPKQVNLAAVQRAVASANR